MAILTREKIRSVEQGKSKMENDKMEPDILSKHEIEQTLRKHQDLLRKYNVKRLGLFGSYVKDTAHGSSGIDLLVEFEKLSFDKYMGYVFSLKIYLRKRLTS